jgi:glycosyltransferase involved in cell wall biosynthesis
MKILYIITQADGGGAQNYTLALAKHFNGAIAAGHRAGSDSASNEAGKLFIDAQRAGLKTFELKHLKRKIDPWQDVLAVWEIRELIKTYEPDIVHLNSSKAGILGSFAAIGLKKKTVFTAHGFIFNELLSTGVKNFYLSLEKIASGYRDHIITVSEADRKSALKIGLIKADKITTIHNGIGQINFLPRDDAKKQLNLFADKFIFGCVANFYKTKGVGILIDAVSMLNDEIKNHCQFIVIGDGSEFENFKLKIENLHLQGNIKLLGKMENASKYLHAFDCLIMPSRKEGLPYALLEAMQAGLPIIATNVGGIPEALGDAGILIDPENPQALAEAIVKIADDQEKRSVLSRLARERASLFTEEKMFAETEEVYKLLIKK